MTIPSTPPSHKLFFISTILFSISAHLVKMVKIAAIVLLMGILANAAAIPVSEPAALAKRGNAEVIAEQTGDVPDFNTQITEPTGEGDRGDVADETNLSTDIVPETEAASSAASSVSSALSPASDTDRLLYSTSMPAFLTAKRNKNPGNLDWSDDGCSKSPDKPSGFNFLDS